MIVFLGFIFQLAISVYIFLFGWASFTNMGFSDTSGVEKIVGIILICASAYLLYDLSTMFNYVGDSK